MGGRAWTSSEDAAASNYAIPASVTAARLGRSVASVHSRRAVLRRASAAPDPAEGLVSTTSARKIAGGRAALSRLERECGLRPARHWGRAAQWSPQDVMRARAALDDRLKALRICSEDDCESPTHARGLCKTHYRRTYGSEANQQANRKMEHGGLVHPPSPSEYHLLARTCQTCGFLITTPAERIRRDTWAEKTPCPACRHARAQTGEERERIRLVQGRYHDETIVTARKWGYEWTGPELEVLMRDDLSVTEIARILGRTYGAVVQARQRIGREPKMARLAGARTPLARKAQP